jgi:hypothetical protein
LSGKIYEDDWGVVIKVTVGTDLTLASSYSYYVIKPNGIIASWNCSVQSPATDGILTYTTQSNDLNVPGTYKLQSVVVFPTGSFTGELTTFRVYKKGE